MNDQKDFFDPSLTPKNAHQKGYEYIDDIIYNTIKPDDTLKNIQELISQHDYKLGSPSDSREINIYRGLYMPIEEKIK